MKKIKRFLYVSLFVSGIFSCSSSEDAEYAVFGADFKHEKDVLSAEQLDAVFEKLEIGDTAEVIFSTKIDAVCQKKGCWMDVDLANDYVARVTFLDYGFFVPLNSAGSEALIKGQAFWKTDTAAEKRHYAEDAGVEVTEEELSDEIDYAPHVVATGVLIKK
jgi:hypothetical protein